MELNNEINLLQEELSNILRQLHDEMGENPDSEEVDFEETHGISLKELEESFNEKQPRMVVKFEKIHPDAVSPKYNYSTDSGFDLYSVTQTFIEPLSRALVPTGLKFDIKEGFEIQVRPKSGLALNQGLTVLNTPGTVDSGYNGEIKVILYNSTHDTIQIHSGMKIAQACICPVVNGRWINFTETDKLSEKDRGENGFGSTGI